MPKLRVGREIIDVKIVGSAGSQRTARATMGRGIKAVMFNTETVKIYEDAGFEDFEKWRRAHDAPIGAERERLVRRRAKLIPIMEATEAALYGRNASDEDVRDLLMYYAECVQQRIARAAEETLLTEIEATEEAVNPADAILDAMTKDRAPAPSERPRRSISVGKGNSDD